MAITEREVHAAADALLLDGERPTIERVRLKLGRGSPNTITGFLNTWFAQLGVRLTGQATDNVPEPVLAAARQLWQAAQEAAHTDTQIERAAQEAQLTQQQAALAARARELEADQARLAAREADLEVALTALREQLAAAHDQVSRLTGLRDAAHAAQLQAEDAAQAARRETEVVRGQFMRQQSDQAATLREVQERHAAHERRWLTELDAERQYTKRLQADLEQVRQGVDRERAEIQAAQARCADQMRAAERTEAGLRAQLEAARVRLEACEEAARRDADAAETRELERARHVRELTAQLAAKEKQLDAMVSAMAKRPRTRRSAAVATAALDEGKR